MTYRMKASALAIGKASWTHRRSCCSRNPWKMPSSSRSTADFATSVERPPIHLDRRREGQDRSVAGRLQSAPPAQLAGPPDTQRVHRPTSGSVGRKSRVSLMAAVSFRDQRHNAEQSTFGGSLTGEAYGDSHRDSPERGCGADTQSFGPTGRAAGKPSHTPCFTRVELHTAAS